MNGIVTNSGHVRPVRPRWNVKSLVGVGLQNAHSQVMYSQCSTRHLPDSCRTGMAHGLWWGEAPTLKGEPVKETSLGLMDLNAQVADSRATSPSQPHHPPWALTLLKYARTTEVASANNAALLMAPTLTGTSVVALCWGRAARRPEPSRPLTTVALVAVQRMGLGLDDV